jgi:hypothetical protein
MSLFQGVLQLNLVNHLGRLLLPSRRGREYVKFSCACTCILHNLRFLRREESCLGFGKFYNTELRVKFVPRIVGVTTCRFCVRCGLPQLLFSLLPLGFGVSTCTIFGHWGSAELALEVLLGELRSGELHNSCTLGFHKASA